MGDSQHFEAGSSATAPAEPVTLAAIQRSMSIPPRLIDDVDPGALDPPPAQVPSVATGCQSEIVDSKWTSDAAERQRAAAAVAQTQQAQHAQRSPQLSRRSTAEIEPRWLAPALQASSPASAAAPPATVQQRFSIPPRLTEDIDAEVPVPAPAPEPQLSGGTSLLLSAVMGIGVDEVCLHELSFSPWLAAV